MLSRVPPRVGRRQVFNVLQQSRSALMVQGMHQLSQTATPCPPLPAPALPCSVPCSPSFLYAFHVASVSSLCLSLPLCACVSLCSSVPRSATPCPRRSVPCLSLCSLPRLSSVSTQLRPSDINSPSLAPPLHLQLPASPVPPPSPAPPLSFPGGGGHCSGMRPRGGGEDHRPQIQPSCRARRADALSSPHYAASHPPATPHHAGEGEG